MADSVGSGFPTTGIQRGHIFYDLDERSLFVFLGGNPTLQSSWRLLSGIFNGDPDTSLWGSEQSGAIWFNSIEGKLKTWNGSSAVEVITDIGFNHKVVSLVQEDFWAHTSSPYVARSGGTQSAGTLVTGRIGITRLSTGTTSGTVVGYFCGSGNESIEGNGNTGIMYETTWVLKLNTSDSNVLLRVGNLVSGGTVNPPSNGRYFEKLGTDTNFFMVTRGGSVETRTDTGVVADTGYHTFKVIQSGVESIQRTTFILDNNVLLNSISNPLTTSIRPSISLVNLAAVDRTIDIDYFEFRVSGLGR